MFPNKSTTRSFIFLIVFVLIILGSCKKYPEGPLLNLVLKTTRIDGAWDVEYFSINSYDSTSYLKSQIFYGAYGFSKDEMVAIFGAPYPYNKRGYWEFKNKKNDLHIHLEPYPGSPDVSLGPYGANDVVWEIRRLTSNELWLKTTFNSKEYYVKFKHVDI